MMTTIETRDAPDIGDAPAKDIRLGTRTVAAIALAACLLITSGCLQRTLRVTTEPPGALVWINDIEAGRTPLEADFTYYGTFSVRIRKEGYEPITTTRKIKAPIQEQPGIDLVADVLPIDSHHRPVWHFDLERVIESRMSEAEAEQAVIQQARQYRSLLKGPEAETSPPAPTSPTPPETPGR